MIAIRVTPTPADQPPTTEIVVEPGAKYDAVMQLRGQHDVTIAVKDNRLVLTCVEVSAVVPPANSATVTTGSGATPPKP